ncbi:DUF6387 family protein [Endozoicomonas ascidiicola]|uniref:DUF6387 family protein n=1 Tax=Endozoicomonas ascidiicola TaxID=1698521 RepID=UPI000A5E156F|nr:DUF6387 family protein [Endozoicomonas ascidiicola]
MAISQTPSIPADFGFVRRNLQKKVDPNPPLRFMDNATVKPLTLFDISELLGKAINDDVDLSELQNFRFDDVNTTNPSVLYCTIDLSQDEKVLMEDFLLNIRFGKKLRGISSKPTKPVRPSNIDKLIRWRILAYIDFTLWQAIAGVTVNSHLTSVFLYPNHEFSSQDVDTKIESLAKAAMTEEFISNLRAQGMKQYRESEEFSKYL